MPYALPDGRTLPMDTPWEYKDINYPANWLRLSTEEERAQLGITWQLEEEPWDQRFYWGRQPDGTLIPKDHGDLVKQWVGQTKQTAGSLLAPTDWYIVRQSETGAAVPAEKLTYRLGIRAASNAKEQQIKATTTTEELAAYITGPDYPAWPAEDQPVRARNADGTFIGDDPATPNVDEAWVDGGQE